MGFGLALWGLWRLTQQPSLTVLVSGILVFLSNSVLLLVLLAFDFDFFNISVFRPYSLVCYGLFGLWLAIGLDDFIRRSIKTPELQNLGTVIITLLLGSLLLFQNLSKNDRSADNFAKTMLSYSSSYSQKTRYFLSMVIRKQGLLATIIMLRSDDLIWS